MMYGGTSRVTAAKPPEKTVGAQPAELMDGGKATANNIVVDTHMAGQCGVIGKNNVIAHHAIVRDVHVGHDPVVVADAGNATFLGGTPINGAEFAKGIAVANFQFRWLAAVLFVLRILADRCELKDAVVAAYRCQAFHDGMRTHRGSGTDLYPRTDHGIGPDANASIQLSAWIDDRGRVYVCH